MGNVFGKDRGARGVQPWAAPITVGKALRELYTSLGDVTLTGNNTIATLLDGPEKVVRYGALTLGDGTTPTSLTASNRCKGLTIICDSLLVKNNATLNMTGRGARVMCSDDPCFPFIDFKIPNQITLSSDRVSLASALKCIKDNGFAPWDQGAWQALVAGLFGFNLSVSQPGSVILLSATGGGSGGVGRTQSTGAFVGNTGSAGTNGGMGGGGSGAFNGNVGSSYSLQGGYGCPYSGGSGQGGVLCGSTNGTNAPLASKWSGPGGKGGNGLWSMSPTGHLEDPTNPFATGYASGGGAGNPGGPGNGNGSTAGGNGCGGKLVIICYGNVVVNSGGKIEANGMPGGDGPGYVSGGGSGGGHISIITQGSCTNNGTIQATGGVGGSTGTAGGPGGAGSVVTKTFTDMGWT